MKRKVQAQRKFAQRTNVPQPTTTATSATSSTPNERRPIETSDRSANIYNNNTSATRLLDRVAFRHPGMHRPSRAASPQLTVRLVKLPENVSNEQTVNLPSTSRASGQNDYSNRYCNVCRCVKENDNSYFLRSRSRSKSDTQVVEHNKVTSRKRGRPRKCSVTRQRDQKRPKSPEHETGSEDETPLSNYRKKQKILPSDDQNSMDTSPIVAHISTSIADNFTDEDSNMGPLVLEEDDSNLGPLVLEEDGNNDEDYVVNGTSHNGVDQRNQDSSNMGPLVLKEVGNNDEDYVVNVTSHNGDDQRNQGNNEREDAESNTFMLTYDDSREINVTTKVASEGSTDEYEDDLFMRDPTDERNDIPDFPNLGSDELNVYDFNVELIKEEDTPTKSNADSRGVTAGPSRSSVGVIEEAPVFYPTEEEFDDPMEFYSKVESVAMRYGICRVVPPESFQTKCRLKNLSRVSANHQYIGRMFKRWSSGTREMCAIRAHLASHSVVFTRPPLIDGLEVDLPKMFQTVQKYGGFLEVSQKQLWTRVAKDMNYVNILNPGKRLDHLYVKYLLPYDIMKPEDREILHSKVENLWQKKYRKLLHLARNPLNYEKLIVGESDSSSDEDYTEEEEKINKAMYEIPNNDKSTRPILVSNFQKINDNAVRIFFPQHPHGPSAEEVENLYWSKVSQATDHICVYTAAVDTTDGGHGFSTEEQDNITQHKWNLKNFQHNEANILKALGPMVSVTTPVLHMGMLFSTHCWHRDPHDLPWVEYHHEGKPKVWYAIPDIRSYKFRKTVQKLCPTVVQNKSLWLSSDQLMIPPELLLIEGIALTKTTQNPGEYVFVCPKAYTSTICTGLTITESVYFAQETWLQNINEIFLKLHETCEPMMFPPEQLLIALALDPRTTPSVMQMIYSNLATILKAELAARCKFEILGLVQEIVEISEDYDRNWNCKEKECDICRRPLYFGKLMGRFRNNILSKMCLSHYKEIQERLTSRIDIILVLHIRDTFLKSITEKLNKQLTL